MKVDGLKIDIAIAEKGLHRAEFAEKCGISKQALCAIINKGSTSTFTAVQIAKALGVSAYDLLAENN